MPGRAAVVGTSFGCRVHVPALRAAGFDVIALVGQDADRTGRRAARAEIDHACTSLVDALALGVEVVTIATPPGTHASLAIQACRAGAHVICEKPFALDAAEAEAMCAAANDAGVVGLVGNEFRWAEDRATIAAAIADGLIGEPRLCTIVQHVPLAADPETPLPEWWFDAERGGGWLGASGSHVVDQVRVWHGEFATVSARLPVVSARDHVAEDTFLIRATMDSGVEVALVQTAASWSPSVSGVTVVSGTHGTLETNGREVRLSDRSGSRVLDPPAQVRLPPVPESDDPRHRYTHLELGPYTRLCEALRARIDGEDVAAPLFADGLAAMRVLDAVRASDASGGAAVAVHHGSP